MRFGKRGYGDSLRDYLSHKTVETSSPVSRRPTQCEVADCYCDGRGGADIAIQDRSGVPIAYCCQRGYLERLISLGKDQMSQAKESPIKVVKVPQERLKVDPPKSQPRPFASIIQPKETVFPSYDDDFERYADSYVPNDYEPYAYDDL